MQTNFKPVVADFDDYCDNTIDKLKYVEKLKQAMPGMKVTLFAVPAKCSPETIQAAKSLGDWVALGMHGWQHTLGECWSWTSEEAKAKMLAAYDMGINGWVFRAPKWIIDVETYIAAKELGWVVADHKDWRIINTGARTYTYNQPLRNPPYTRVHGHLPNVSDNGIEEHFHDFLFEPEREFKLITEIC